MFKQIFVLVALAAVASSSPIDYQDVELHLGGGTNAPLGRFPYMASLAGASNQFWCGCAIINNRWVLSAAHCFVPGVPQNGLRIRVGSLQRSSGGIVHSSSRHVAHPNYDPNTLRADIGVIQTATVIAFNSNVGPLALGSTAIGGGVNAVLAGWGGTQQLTHITTTTMTNAECRNRVGSNNAPYVIDQKLCTFSNNNQG
jgi:secreted trypsin-like serine protease